jgi:hypothetical protein
MLSEDNIERINDRIESLLRELRFTHDSSKKARIFDEINNLKGLLMPQPPMEEIVAQTLRTLAGKSGETRPRTSEPTVADVLTRLFVR